MKKKLYLTIALLAAPAVCLATDYYVREDGTAASKEVAVDCLLASTAMSVTTHNAETFTAGDNIYLCDDDPITTQIVPPSSGSASGYITYDGDGDNDGVDAEVQGGVQRLLTKMDYLKFTDIHFTTSAKAITLASGGSNNWVTGCFFDALTQQGVYGSGPDNTHYSQDWLIEDSTFQNIGVSTDTASVDINITGFARRWTMRNNVHIGDDATHGVDGVTFANINVAGGDGSGHLIDNMTCSNYYENCVDFKGTSESSAGEGPTIVSNSTFSGNSGTEGLAHIHNNSNNIIFDKVRFLDTSSNAIAFVGIGAGDDACGYITVRHCLFDGIAKTIFTDVGVLDDEALGHNELINNTMIDSGQTTFGYSIDIGSNSNVFENNIFYQSSQNATRDIIFRFNVADYYTSATMDYNIYKKLDESTESLVNITAVGYKTLAQLQADGKEINGYYTDPLLDANGRPALNSPVINAGTDVGLPFWGAGPEIGAYEVGGYPIKVNNLPYTMPIWRMGVQ